MDVLVTMPKSHNTNKITAIVYNIIFNSLRIDLVTDTRFDRSLGHPHYSANHGLADIRRILCRKPSLCFSRSHAPDERWNRAAQIEDPFAAAIMYYPVGEVRRVD